MDDCREKHLGGIEKHLAHDLDHALIFGRFLDTARVWMRSLPLQQPFAPTPFRQQLFNGSGPMHEFFDRETSSLFGHFLPFRQVDRLGQREHLPWSALLGV